MLLCGARKVMKSQSWKCENYVISPTCKRTEGRAPVWGSEFTLKAAAIQGGSNRNRCYAERKVVRSGDWWHLTAISPNPP
jgi:hypothetical protein